MNNMDEFRALLKWRFELLITRFELKDNSDYVVEFKLSASDSQRLSALKSNGFEELKTSVENQISEKYGLPLSLQSTNDYEFKHNQLILVGSKLYIEGMLESLFTPIHQRAAQKFIIPVDHVISNSKDTMAKEFFRSILLADNLDDYRGKEIPLQSVSDFCVMVSKGIFTSVDYKNGLLIGLAFTYINLSKRCAGLDELQYTGKGEKDSENNIKAENYRENEKACIELMNECFDYMKLLDWDSN